ncbi:hypothetical protein L211DRAFT_847931 [Terfezia boudieri ATCC MYA-4762]|uniref:Uncharacterized protein n=1 Tax=Terfezia boudieri ATCC MYA-4762 TaxID=1051890 RepID=A0A3N4LV55_9PEZI|nr:hypothetical protein L211DRAFT_847931 [Terfezia boudieri ATCC MYA-4762]
MPGAWAAKHRDASSAIRVAPNKNITRLAANVASRNTRATRPPNVTNTNTRAPNNNSTARPANVANNVANANRPSLAQRAAAPVPRTSTDKPLPGVWKTPEKRSPLSQKLLRKVDATRKTLAQRSGEPIVPKAGEPKHINTVIKQSSPISRYLAPKIGATRLSLVDRAALPYSAPQPKKAQSTALPVWKPKTVQVPIANSNRKGPIRDVDVNDCGEANDVGEDERGRRTERTSSINRLRGQSTDSFISDDGIEFIDYPSPIHGYNFGEGLLGTARDSEDSVEKSPSTDPFDFDYDTDSGEGLFGALFEQEHLPCGGRGITTPATELAQSYFSVPKFQEIAERTSGINRLRGQSTDSFISDEGIEFIDYPSLIHGYNIREGLFGTARDSEESVEKSPSTDPFDFDHDTDSGEGFFGALFVQDHLPCGGRGITTPGTELAQSYFSVPEFQDIAGGVESRNEENSLENLDESTTPAETLFGVDQPEEEKTLEGLEKSASTEQQRTGNTENISDSKNSEINKLIGFDHPEEENTLEVLKEVASAEEQRTGHAEGVYSRISESKFQEAIGGLNILNEESTSEGAEEQQAVVERQSTDATHQAFAGQLEAVYCQQIIQLEQTIKEAEKSELCLQATLDKKAEISRQLVKSINRLEKELTEQNLKEKEARQLAEISYARLRKAINERGAIGIDDKVQKSCTRLLAAITVQAVEYQEIVQSFGTVEKSADIASRNKGKHREIVHPIKNSHKQFKKLKEKEPNYISKIVPSSSKPESSRQNPRSRGKNHWGHNTRPTRAGSFCSVSSDRYISSIVLTAEELYWVLNRPEVKQSARIRDHALGVKRDSAVSASASPEAEGSITVEGDQESGEESEIF